jgi:FAD/FMN-containing dehydrogenase/Fe-S oxidoreductase
MLNPFEIASDLSEIINGDALHKEWQRSMYSTDASLYEILPICVVIPKNENDVIKTVKYAYENNIPLTARGGGTSLAGQTVGNGIIIDFSKYMNKILEISVENNFIVIEPGLYKTELDNYLNNFGKFFPPDPSSSDFCTLGGMISNNSSGPHSVKYGSAIDYVISLKVILSNGEIIETEPIKPGGEEWIKKISIGNLESRIYRQLLELIDNNLKKIKEKEPKVKNSAGYKLLSIIDKKNNFDLSKIFVSAEGTLGIILQAKLRIVDIPKYLGTVMLQFNKIEEMGSTVCKVLETSPSAVELLDHYVLKSASMIIPEIKEKIPNNVNAILLIEYDGNNFNEILNKMKYIKRNIIDKSSFFIKEKIAYSEEESQELWNIRKKSLPYSMKVRKNGKKPAPFIEDITVPPEKLPNLIKKLYAIYKKYDVSGVVYGHAGDGQLHTRPLLNLKEKTDIKKMKKIADEVYSFVIENKGSITGEHGDGIVRSEYLAEMYDEVYDLFKVVKKLFDPQNILNPISKINNEKNIMLKNIRYAYYRNNSYNLLNWDTKSSLLKKITGYANELSYDSEIDLCHGCGNCREITPGRMCPVFKAYRNELDSCRGRINILRWLIKEDGLPVNLMKTSDYQKIVYDHCIQCKMCYVECPSNVNVGKLMAEARANYVKANNIPRGYGLFANIDKYENLGYKLYPFSNYLLSNKLFRNLFERITYIDKDRQFPKYVNKSFTEHYKNHLLINRKQHYNKSVVFFYDTYIKYHNPRIGILIVKLLERNGFNVIVPPQKSSGISAIFEGSTSIAKKIISYNLDNLAPYINKHIPIITFSPSSSLALKLEYMNIINNQNSRAVANLTFDIHEFLFSIYKKGELNVDFNRIEKDVLIHIHCHDIVQRIDQDIISLLKLIPGLNFQVLENGCCGIGGAFGFIKGNYKRSMKIGEPLFNLVKKNDKTVYSTGESCSLQINEGTGKEIKLTVELISEAYGLI